MSVAPSKGIAVRRPMVVRASMRERPCFKSTSMPSTMTMALSTSIPMARMNAARLTRCSVPSKPPSTSNEPKTMVRRLRPMMSPDLKPIVKMRTTTTISTDSSRFTRNVLSADSTRSGWLNTFSNFTPKGMVFLNSSMVSSTCLPTLIMSLSATPAMEMPKARCPSRFNSLRVGSA